MPKADLVEVSLTFDAAATHRTKIYPLLRNVTGDCADVRLLSWTPAGIRAKSPFLRGTLQTKRPGGWEPKEPADEIHVRHGDLFRLWIAADDQHPQGDVERARDERRLGILTLLVNGQEMKIAL